MGDITTDTLIASCETGPTGECTLQDLSKTKSDKKTKYDFIAKPLQPISINRTPTNYVDCASNSVEDKAVICTYISTNCEEDIMSPTEFDFGVTEEIVGSELGDGGIFLDKITYESSVPTSDSLSLCSVLDQLPEGNNIVDGNVNIELYLECSDDSENSSHERDYKLKPNKTTAEATSQIKMDTQFKVSFPLIPERGLKCSLCKLCFLSKDFLREHVVIRHFTDFIFCGLCPYFTKSKKYFNRHIQTRHSVTTVGLSDIQSETNIVKSANIEAVKGIDGRLRESDFDVNFGESKISVKSERQFKKINCKFRKSDDHNQERKIKCEQCEFRTKSNRLLNYHKQSMHNKNREIFRCLICDYTCLQKRSFDAHCRTHAGDFEFQCDLCCKKFVSKHLLTKHKRIHGHRETTEESVNTSSLTDYTAKPTGTKLHSVSTQTRLLKKSFISRKNKRNLKNYTNKMIFDSNLGSSVNSCFQVPCGKKLMCNFDGCNKVCRDSFNLRNHMATHTKSKLIKCTLCMFTCIQTSSLNHHLKTRHSTCT